jgi:hypothetical protein
MSVARILFVCAVLPLVAACSTVTQPDADPASASASFARSLADGPVMFVLSRVEAQTSDPIITFDHVCQGARYQHRISDTLMLWPDGRARRAFTTDRLADGTVQASDHLGFAGTWSVFTEPSWYYYSSGPSIVVALAPDSGQKGSAFEMPMRIERDGALSDLGALGGSCPDSPNDGREAVFTFTRRTETSSR